MAISAWISSKKRPIWDREAAFYGAATVPMVGSIAAAWTIASVRISQTTRSHASNHRDDRPRYDMSGRFPYVLFAHNHHYAH